MIYADIVKQALKTLTPNKLATRRSLYEQLRQGLKNALEESDPPLDGRDKVIELRLLETTIRRFEADVRAGVDVTADDYAPWELEAEQTRLYALKVISRAPAAPTGAPSLPSDQELAAALSLQMRQLSYGAAPDGFRESPLRPGTVGALLRRFVTEMAFSQGRFGLLWIFLEPIVLIGTTITIYLALDQRNIMNMDLIPFAILGVVAWLLIRMTAIKVAAAATTSRDLFALPPIRIVSVVLGQASAQFILYTVAMVAGLLFGNAFGHGQAPENWVRFFVFWTLLWVIGIATGVTFAPLFISWRAAPRFILMSTRFVSWTSGLVFVSEQFPTELKAYILWNPLIHGMQLMRSAYFPQYETEDGSLLYFLCSIGIILIMAAACERILAPRVEPA